MATAPKSVKPIKLKINSDISDLVSSATHVTQQFRIHFLDKNQKMLLYFVTDMEAMVKIFLF